MCRGKYSKQYIILLRWKLQLITFYHSDCTNQGPCLDYWNEMSHFQMAGDNVPNCNHLTFLKFSSRNKPSISSGKTCFVNSLLGISSRIKIIIPSPFLFRPNLQDTENSITKNLDVNKESSSLVSVITRRWTYFDIISLNWSKLFVRD